MKRLSLVAFLLCVVASMQAQDILLDVELRRFEVLKDSIRIEMMFMGNTKDVGNRDAILLTPFLKEGKTTVDLPAIQLNGKTRQTLFARSLFHKNPPKTRQKDVEYINQLNKDGSFHVAYQTSILYAPWMNKVSLGVRKEFIDSEEEKSFLSNIIIQERREMKPPVLFEGTQEPAFMSVNQNINQNTESKQQREETRNIQGIKQPMYKGSFVEPIAGEMDERNKIDLNFSLEEAQVIAKMRPQMLSLKELFMVASSYKESDVNKFYEIIKISVELHNVDPIANLNAAAMEIELGNVDAAKTHLQMSPRETLAYKNCQGAYELMTGNIYEGIRLLKSAAAEGSEEAAYNLNEFFSTNK